MYARQSNTPKLVKQYLDHFAISGFKYLHICLFIPQRRYLYTPNDLVHRGRKPVGGRPSQVCDLFRPSKDVGLFFSIFWIFGRP